MKTEIDGGERRAPEHISVTHLAGRIVSEAVVSVFYIREIVRVVPFFGRIGTRITNSMDIRAILPIG
jgi:hypothetical protein